MLDLLLGDNLDEEEDEHEVPSMIVWTEVFHELWQANLDGSSIHLAVEGSCGGTTLGLQMAKQPFQMVAGTLGITRDA